MRHDLERYIERHGLLPNQTAAILAVSGGLDSMVLLHGLAEMAPDHRWRLTVVHVNHQLRGADSLADEALTREAAEALGLDIVVERVDVATFAKTHGLSLEMAARRLRHDALANAALTRGIPRVVTAHHADDQVELFFIRLFRGSSAIGLGGMAPSSPSPSDARILLARPLLEHRKADLHAFADARGIKYREDPLNADTRIPRNRIRHHLIPYLKTDFGEPAIENIVRTMEVVREEGRLAEESANHWLKSRQCGFETLSLAVQRHAVRLQLLNLGVVPSFSVIESLRLNSDQSVIGPFGYKLRRNTDGAIVVDRRTSNCFVEDAELRIDLMETTTVTFETASISATIYGKGQTGVSFGGDCRELFDADRVGRWVRLRHWRPGDRFQPIGMPASVKLQDLFVNAKVPRAERHRKLVATTEGGTIFWVEGLRIGDSVKVTEQTKSILEWRWTRCD